MSVRAGGSGGGAVVLPFLLLVGPLASTSGGSAQERQLATLFPQRAEIGVETDGLQRLSLPPEVLAACRSDLSDVRILNAAGREVPYFVDSGLRPGGELELSRSLTAEVLEVERHRREAEGSPSRFTETYELAAPAEPSPTGYWDLVLETPRSTFVRRVRLEAVAEGGTKRELRTDRSLFRLDEPRSEKLHLTLPALPATSLSVTLEGEEDGYLEPAFRYRASRSLPVGETALAPLAILSIVQAGGETLVELERPRGLVPDALVVETGTELFRRRVEVYDAGPGGGDVRLGAETLFRLQHDGGPEQREVAVRPASGDRLRLEIEDGDSPPLSELGVSTRVRRPTLLFTLPASTSGAPAGWLLFGGGRAYRPRYDVADLLPSLPAFGQQAEMTVILRGGDRPAVARLGVVAENPAFDPTPALAFAMRPGARLDPRLFTHRRPLQAPESAEGLIRLDLEPDDQAAARTDLADLRIVDSDGHQRSYLLESVARRPLFDLAVEGPETDEGSSVYRFALPTSPVVIDRLELEIDVPFFDRPFELAASRAAGERAADGEVVLARGRIERRVGEAAPLLLSFAAERIDELELRVTDGDDAPLPLRRARGRFPLAALFFAAPRGEYSLLLGSPEAAPPSYELGRVRELVLAVASVPAETAELGRNPAYSPAARWSTESGLQRSLLWGALLLAILVLTVMTLRLARSAGTG